MEHSPKIKGVNAFAEFGADGPDSSSIRDLDFPNLAASMNILILLGRMSNYVLQPERTAKHSAENLNLFD